MRNVHLRARHAPTVDDGREAGLRPRPPVAEAAVGGPDVTAGVLGLRDISPFAFTLVGYAAYRLRYGSGF